MIHSCLLYFIFAHFTPKLFACPLFSSYLHVFPMNPIAKQTFLFLKSWNTQCTSLQLRCQHYWKQPLPRHFHKPYLLKLFIDITFKFFRLALMWSKIWFNSFYNWCWKNNINNICISTHITKQWLTRVTITNINYFKYFNTTTKMPFNCTRAFMVIKKTFLEARRISRMKKKPKI